MNGEESTRVKDLVDLAIIATTQTINSDELVDALRSETGKRAIDYPIAFSIPRRWTGKEFNNSTRGTGISSMSMSDAAVLIRDMLDTVQHLPVDETDIWNPEQRA